MKIGEDHLALAANDMLGSLRLQSAPQQIVDRILAAIAVGILYPGDRLPTERELAEILDVSRTTVRQALGRLSALGIVDARRGRGGGTFVQPIRPRSLEAGAVLRTLGPVWEQLEAMLDYRNLAQQLIARTAAQRHTSLDDEAMLIAVSAYGKATTSKESREADHALHEAIARATRNPHLIQLNRELTTAANLGFTVDPYSADLHSRAFRQHGELTQAILSSDPEAAANLAGEHFRLTSAEPWRSAFAEAQSPSHDDAPNTSN